MSAHDAPIIMLTNAVAPDKLGGLERYVRELSAGLVSTGRRVTVVTKRISDDHPAAEVGDDGVEVIRYAVPSKRDPGFAVKYPLAVTRAVDRAVRQVGDNAILHTHFVVPALAPAFRRLPYVHTFHAPTYRELLDERQASYLLPDVVQRPAVRALRAAERTVLRRALTVIALSEFIRGEIATLDPRVAARTVLLPGGVDYRRFTRGAPRSTVDVSGDPLLMTARRFTPRTGVLELVQAMPEVLRSLPRAHLALLGDGGSRADIEAEVARLGLGAAVSFQGRVFDDDLVDWYRRADIAVMPTQNLEGFGLSTAEALGCGTPVVATPVGANPELVIPLDSRLLTAGTAPIELAAGIVRVTALLATAGRERLVPPGCVSHYGWDHVVDRHFEIYAAVGGAGASTTDLPRSWLRAS